MTREGLLTIGVEEEYQILDARGELHAHIDTLRAKAAPRLGDKVKREMMQSVVEVGTTICENVDEARNQLGEMRQTLAELLQPEGLRIACAGTHPFSRWQEQQIAEYERYKMLEEELQDVVRSLVIFGLHVHVAIPDAERRIEVLNEARYFLPHLLALSFFFSSRRRHTRFDCDWSSDVCSSDLRDHLSPPHQLERHLPDTCHA